MILIFYGNETMLKQSRSSHFTVAEVANILSIKLSSIIQKQTTLMHYVVFINPGSLGFTDNTQ